MHQPCQSRRQGSLHGQSSWQHEPFLGCLLKILRKELTIVGTWNSSFGSQENDWREAVQAMQDKRLDLKSLITHRFSLAEYQEAFSLMRERREMYCKVMFVM